MPTRKGSVNRRTGKTTARAKSRTHWGAKSRARHSAAPSTPKKQTGKK